MRRTDATRAGLKHSPCTASDVDWQTAVSALSRAAGRYGEILISTGRNRAAAASRLWKQGRHDTTLKDDLAKAACALLALAEGGAEGDGSRPGKLSKLDRDPEVAAFLCKRLETMYLDEARAEALQRFGPDRVPSRASIHRYWQRQKASAPSDLAERPAASPRPILRRMPAGGR